MNNEREHEHSQVGVEDQRMKILMRDPHESGHHVSRKLEVVEDVNLLHRRN